MKATAVRLAKRFARKIVGRPIFGRSILVYHRVAKTEFDPWNIAVLPDEFERQLVALRKKTVLPLQEFVLLHRQNRLPQDAVAITFDDGYACNALVAAPMLQSLGYPATFFVVSDAIERGGEFWWDQLEFIFHAPGFDYDTAKRLLVNYSANATRATVGQGQASHGAFLELWTSLRHISTEGRRQYLVALMDRTGLKMEVRPTHRPMTPAELRSLAANPLFEIGGHTATHPSLPMLSRAEQEREIVSGVQFLEATLGKPIRSFSYPFGEWEEATRNIVMAAGFECALVTEHKRVRPSDNRYTLPRRQTGNRNAHIYQTEPDEHLARGLVDAHDFRMG
jgi:peptidoglycan/xylan/chitin deacetylase (PgdA/CDA1 family)